MNTTGLKKSNLFKVLKAVKLQEVLSKPEIARITGLTAASVHNFVSELLAAGLLVEEGESPSNGGRKALLYSFNDSIRYIMGIYVALHSVTCCLFDLAFNPVYRCQKPIDLDGDDVQSTISLVLKQIDTCLLNSRIPKEKIAGIGVTVPGPVNREKGLVSGLAGAKNWIGIPLKTLVESATGLPVVLDKDNCGIVLHYKWAARPKEEANVVHISITDGIGAGVLIGGSLYQGSHNLAGEIGHMTVIPDGVTCTCGNKGCLEQYASNAAILREVRQRLKRGEKSDLATDSRLSIEDVIQAAKSGDALSIAVFTVAARILAIGLCNVVRMFDPDEVVLDCQWLKELPQMFALVQNRLFENTSAITRGDICLSLGDIDDLLIKAAATLPYEQLFGSYKTCTLI